MNDFTRMFGLFSLVSGILVYVYFNHWEDFYPLFGYGILFLVFFLIVVGLGAMIAFLHDANSKANFKVFKFTRVLVFLLSCLGLAAPLFWVSEPLIYKSVSTTIGERVMPDWYFELFDRDKPEFETIKLEKTNLF